MTTTLVESTQTGHNAFRVVKFVIIKIYLHFNSILNKNIINKHTHTYI